MGKKKLYNAEMYANYIIIDAGEYELKEFKLKINNEEKVNIKREVEIGENWISEVKYKLRFWTGVKVIEEIKRTDNYSGGKLTEYIKSKIIFINDRDIVDDVLHASYLLKEQNKKELPLSISFTTLVDGLQYRFEKRLFTVLEKKARNEEFDDAIKILDSHFISDLESFIQEKVYFLRHKIRDCRRLGCDECVRL